MSPSWDTIDVVAGNPRSISPSAAGTWKSCPKKWWFKYIEQLPEPSPGEPAILGTFVHAILEDLLSEPAASRNLETAKAHARRIWSRIAASEDWKELQLDDVAALRFRQRAWRTVEAYFGIVEPSEVRPIGREVRLSVEIDGVPFRGFVDLIEEDPITGDVLVTDYKTGAPPSEGKPWSETENREKLWQPLWYSAALIAQGDHHPTIARLLYFNAVETKDGQGLQTRTGRLVADVNDQTLSEARAELRIRWDETLQARERGSAEARPGPLCGWCPFVAHCAEGTDEVVRRWETIDPYTGDRKLSRDAPAVELLGLVD